MLNVQANAVPIMAVALSVWSATAFDLPPYAVQCICFAGLCEKAKIQNTISAISVADAE